MKTMLCAAALAAAVSAPAVGQELGFQDPLLERLAGDWLLHGTIGGEEVTHDISARWVLDHYYLQIHEWSREMTPDGRHEYEAIVLIGWDENPGRYACLWLDTTGGGGLDVDAQVMGRAQRVGDSLPFVFDLPDGSAIYNTFEYQSDRDAWRWIIDVERDGERTEFARVELTRKEEADAGRVTGLGGLFFRSADPAATLNWYRTHLGIDSADWGGFAFQWREEEDPEEVGYTVWGAFPVDTDYFSPSDESFMVNFRVANLEALVEALRTEGVEVVGDIQAHPNGKFAWILDPDGRKIELWEPVPSSEDPYLE